MGVGERDGGWGKREKKVCTGLHQMSARKVHSSNGDDTVRYPMTHVQEDVHACAVRDDAGGQGAMEKQMAN